MSQNVADLKIGVDSSEAVKATHGLDALRDSAGGASRATQALRLEHIQLRQATQQLAESTRTLNGAIGESGGTLDQLMVRLDQTRQKIGGLRSAFDDFARVQQQVEAVGKAFGVTSTAMEAYYRQANQMGLTTQQTVTSMERITEALRNQSIAGAQVRKVLQDYGVSLNGLGAKDAGAVAQQFAEKLRAVKDSVQRYQMSQVVFGPLDPDSYAKLDNPAYVTLDQRRQRSLESQYAAQRATAGRNAVLMNAQADRAGSEYADLSSRFSTGWLSRQTTGMSATDYLVASNKAGLRAPPSNEEERTKLLKWLADNPNSSAARGARGVTGRLYDDVWSSSPGQFVTRAWNNAGDNHGVNEEEIQARFRKERASEGFTSALSNRVGRSFMNTFGLYQGMPDMTDTRSEDKVAKFLADSYTGQRLASFGDTGLSQRQQAVEALKNFTQVRTNPRLPVSAPVWDEKQQRFMVPQQTVWDDKLQTFVVAGADRRTPIFGAADGASKDTLANFTNVYGQEEGTARWNQVRQRLERSRENAMRPGAAEMDQLDEQSTLLAMPRSDRVRAQRYLQFAQGQNADMPGIVARLRADPRAFSDGRIGSTFGTRDDPALTPQQRGAEADIAARTQANGLASDKDGFDKRMAEQSARTALASQGSAALEDLATKQRALDDAYAKGYDLAGQRLTQSRAQQEVDAKRIEQATTLLANMKMENDLLSTRNDRVAFAGSDPSARAQAGIQADLMADFKKAQRDNPKLDQGQYFQERLRTLGLQGAGQGDGISANAQHDLDLAKQSLSVAGQRADIVAKMARDQQVDLEFQDAKAKVLAEGDAKRIAALEAQIAKTKELKDQITLVNAEARAFQMGRDGLQAAVDERAIAALPRDQQARARALQGTRRTLRDDGLLDGNGTAGSGTPNMPGGAATSQFTRNNPTNLEYYPGQVGLTGRGGPNNRFGVYRTAEDGLAAGFNQVLMDFDRGFNTIRTEITKRSPPRNAQGGFENDTEGMIRDISRMSGIGADQRMDLRDPATAKAFMRAMIRRETGKTVDDGVLDRGIDLGMSQGGRGSLGSTSSTPQTRGRAADAALDGKGAEYDATLDTQRQDLAAQHATQMRAEQAARDLLARGLTGQAQIARAGVYDPVDPLGGQRARQQQDSIRAGFETQGVEASAATRQQVEDQKRMNEAYLRGGAALDALTIAMQAEREIRQGSLDATKREARETELLAKTKADQNAAAQQYIKASRDRNQVADAGNDIFASDREIGRRQFNLETDQTVRDRYGSNEDAAKDYRTQRTQDLAMRERTEDVKGYRDMWQSAQSATASALNSVIDRSQTARQAVAGLTKELGSMALQMAEKKLMQAGGDWLSGLFGLGKTAAGAAGAGSAVAEAAPVLGGLYAAGGVFAGGTGLRMYAGGGLIDRPTNFYSSGGQTNVAGEMGPEAILPLRRMPDGNMGVVAKGGGGGGSSQIVVHAPITIQGGPGGKGGRFDDDQSRQMQAHIQEIARGAVQATLADEMRPGGAIYNHGMGR